MPDFPFIDLSDWREKVRKELKGTPIESTIVQQGLEGVVKALYTSHDVDSTSSSFRGMKSGWKRFGYFDQGDLSRFNAEAINDIAGGIEGLDVRIDSWIRYGGNQADGAPMWGTDPWVRALNDIDLSQVDLHIHSGGSFLSQAAVLSHLFDHMSVDLGQTTINWGADPFGSLCTDGKINRSIPHIFRDLANLIRWVQSTQPKGRSLKMSGLPAHMAGASIVSELGLLLSNVVAALRALDAQGLSPHDISEQLEISVPVGANVFNNIAKLRAIRALLSKLFEDCGVVNVSIPIYALSSPRMMTRWDPWVNILRTTTSTFASICGGADSICVLPFDYRLKRTDLGRRIARNVHAIMADECRMDVVADPAKGSYAVESITEDYCARAWDEFTNWEAMGGFFKNINDCTIRNTLRDQLIERQSWIKCGRLKLTGVSSFPNIDETVPTQDSGRQDTQGLEKKAFESFCAERGEGPTIGGAHLSRLKLLVDQKATVLDLEGGLGCLKTTMALSFEQGYDSDVFENLRDQVLLKGGASVFLATIGPQSKWKPRSTFAQNHFAAGGFRSVTYTGANEDNPIPELIDKFKESGSIFICLCAPDDLVRRHGKELIAACSEIGCELIVAGKGLLPHIGHEIYSGCDIHKSLQSLLERMP